MSTSENSLVIFTIGHSTHSMQDFITLLKKHSISKVADIRTIPRSKHVPQFNQDTLSQSLRAASIGYIHMETLGGLRKPKKDSPNKAWRNPSFRGFADYMQTQDFEKGLEQLVQLAQRDHVVILCAEALPWRCHRSLIADALLTRGISVQHIMPTGMLQTHALTPWAKIQGKRVTYPSI
jgi:uncharacterized protein (DUF488 family)